MRLLLQKTRLLAVPAIMLLLANHSAAQGQFSQLTLSFPDKRPFAYSYSEQENAIVIELQKTTPSELGSLDQYDERLVRRVLMKDLGGQGTEVKLVLRDRTIRASINTFQEPFRIVVDLFNRD